MLPPCVSMDPVKCRSGSARRVRGTWSGPCLNKIEWPWGESTPRSFFTLFFYLNLAIWKHWLIALLQVEPVSLHSAAQLVLLRALSISCGHWWLVQCIHVKVLASVGLCKCVFLKLPLKTGQIPGFNLPGPSRQWDDNMKDLWDVPRRSLKSASSQYRDKIWLQ